MTNSNLSPLLNQSYVRKASFNEVVSSIKSGANPTLLSSSTHQAHLRGSLHSDLITPVYQELQRLDTLFGDSNVLLTFVCQGNQKHIVDNYMFFISRNHFHSATINYDKLSVSKIELCKVSSRNSYSRNSMFDYRWVFEAVYMGENIILVMDAKDIREIPGFKCTADGVFSFGNIAPITYKYKLNYDDLIDYIKSIHYYDIYLNPCNYSTVSCIKGANLLEMSEIEKLIHQIAQHNTLPAVIAGSGITNTFGKSIAPFLADLKVQYPMQYCMLSTIAEETGRTVNSVKLSTIFNATFADVKDVHDLSKKICPDGWEIDSNSKYAPISEHWYSSQDSFKEQRKKALKSQGNRAVTKIMEEVDSLNLDQKQFPKTYAAITNSEIPISTFFRKSEQYFLFNDNWHLWEKMLAKYPDVTKEIAKSASTRTTYEKDLMSYFYFVLYALPEYLKSQTGKKWTCIPKLVDSPNELEPPKEDDKTGIVRKRSALTPIVDNDKNTVVVPYASLALHGRQTTYCYSLDYQVLKKGYSFNGNVVMSDCEEKLNGRDDYGLMFYTLTGSQQGRGYPTFLIIFERRKTGTHVHFHRTHPSRSKDNDYNPIHNWVRVCYNWMIGNVARENIIAQQGDLAFVKMDDSVKKDFNEQVKAYDNHIFAHNVLFAPYTSSTKSNILGYIKVTEDNVLQHHEHEWVDVPAGNYEVRACRSWEANPKGVWSLRID